jgi:hypothetical protein
MRYVTVNGQEHELPNEEPRGRDLAELVYDLSVASSNTVTALTASSGTISIDATNLPKVVSHTLTGNVTIAAPTGMYTGQKLTFIFTQGGSAGYTVTWNSVFVQNWSDVGAGTLGAKAAIGFIYDGSKWVQVESLDWGAAVVEGAIKVTTITEQTSGSTLSIYGAQAAGSTSLDISADTTATRVAGNIFAVKNNGTTEAAFDYAGNLALAGAKVSVSTADSPITVEGNRGASSTTTADIILKSAATRNAGDLVDVQNNTTSKLTVAKDGKLTITGVAGGSNAIAIPSTSKIYFGDTNCAIYSGGANEIDISSNALYFTQTTNGIIYCPTITSSADPSTLTLKCRGDDSGSNKVSVTLDTGGAFTSATGKIVACKNGGSEKLAVMQTGKLSWAANEFTDDSANTGNRTVNKVSGINAFGAGNTTLDVTNDRCTATSLVIATLQTADATAMIANVVPTSGKFTVNLSAAATGITKVAWLIIN